MMYVGMRAVLPHERGDVHHAAPRSTPFQGVSLHRFTLAAAVAACAAPLALPSVAGAMVQLDRGIAGVRLDNTPKQVRAALGAPDSARAGTGEFGPYVEYRYAGGITITFGGGKHVTRVSTTGLGDRTAAGVGVRSTEKTVKAKVPGVRCETIAGIRSCHTGAFEPGRRVTDFVIRKGRVARVTVAYVID
jgi:hypothetical protein